jgi:hypothetical protein
VEMSGGYFILGVTGPLTQGVDASSEYRGIWSPFGRRSSSSQCFRGSLRVLGKESPSPCAP